MLKEKMLSISNAIQFVSFTDSINFGFGPTSTANISFLRIVEDGSQVTPSNISVTNVTTAGNITFTVSGTYGEDIGSDDIYEVVSDGESNTIVQFTSFNALNTSSHEHLFVFSPEPFETKTMNIMFLANSTSTVIYNQLVFPDHARHRIRCIALIDKEAPNRG